jgi:NADH-quinone oxidoreductase subunit H
MLMAGWGSANKYSALGGARAAAQLISYELPMVLGVLGVVMIAGTMDLRGIVGAQDVPFIVYQPLGFLLVFLAGLAEVGRTPFDIPYAESELMGGPFLEYSGIHWAMFQLAEYASTFLVAVLTTILLLGGWKGPFIPADGFGLIVMQAFWLFAKVALVFMIIIWIRATVPRFRIDQLMALAWKVFVPLTFVNVLLTAFSLYYGWPDWAMTVLSLATIAAAWAIVSSRRRRPSRPAVRTIRVPAKAAPPAPQAAKPADAPAAAAPQTGRAS